MPTRSFRSVARRAILTSVLVLGGCDDGRVSPSGDAGPDGPDSGATCAPVPAGDCAIDLGSALPVEGRANTDETSSAFSGGSCGGSEANDAWFTWTAPRAGTYTFSTEGTELDTILVVLDGNGCEPGAELGCNDDAPMSRQSRLTLELAACQTVTIVVDGYSWLHTGDVRLRIEGREEDCQDGIDDDNDGLTDCDDQNDCRVRECIEDGDWPAAWADLEWRVLDLTNENRARGAVCGGEPFGPAPPLEMNEVVRVAARLHSQDMGAQDYFSHDSLDGRSFADRMSEAGYTGASPWGENIAAGYSTPEAVVQGWMESPGHCRNIMNPDFRVIGIGYAHVDSSSYGHYWTQDFGGSH